ncbi:MAG: hypothetical protein D6707_11240, partial [Bacteroidetes bacterium]
FNISTKAIILQQTGLFGLFKSSRLLIDRLAVLGASFTALGSGITAATGTVTGLAAGFTQLGAAAFSTLGIISTLTVYLFNRFVRIGRFIRATNDEAIQSFSEWEQTLFGLKATLEGYNKVVIDAPASISKLTNFITDLSKQTGFSRDEIAQALSTLLNFSDITGLTADQIQKLVEVSAKYASVVGVDFQTIILGIDNYFRGYKQTLKTVGIAIEDNEIKTSKYVKALGDTYENLTKAQKAMVASALIQEKMNRVVREAGDYFAGTYQGVLRQLQNQYEQINLLIGEGAEDVRKFKEEAKLFGIRIFRGVVSDEFFKMVGAFREGSGAALEFTGILGSLLSNIVTLIGPLLLARHALKFFIGALETLQGLGIIPFALPLIKFIGISSIVALVASSIVGISAALRQILKPEEVRPFDRYVNDVYKKLNEINNLKKQALAERSLRKIEQIRQLELPEPIIKENYEGFKNQFLQTVGFVQELEQLKREEEEKADELAKKRKSWLQSLVDSAKRFFQSPALMQSTLIGTQLGPVVLPEKYQKDLTDKLIEETYGKQIKEVYQKRREFIEKYGDFTKIQAVVFNKINNLQQEDLQKDLQ